MHLVDHRSGRRPASKVAVISKECKSPRILPESARMHVLSRPGKERWASWGHLPPQIGDTAIIMPSLVGHRVRPELRHLRYDRLNERRLLQRNGRPRSLHPSKSRWESREAHWRALPRRAASGRGTLSSHTAEGHAGVDHQKRSENNGNIRQHLIKCCL